jgi:hypothetical protein
MTLDIEGGAEDCLQRRSGIKRWGWNGINHRDQLSYSLSLIKMFICFTRLLLGFLLPLYCGTNIYGLPGTEIYIFQDAIQIKMYLFGNVFFTA